MKIVISVILVILAAVVVVLVAQFKLIACGIGSTKFIREKTESNEKKGVA